MKKISIVAAFFGTLALAVWTVSLGLDVESKIHYVRLRSKPSEPMALTSVVGGSNWLTQDDSERAVKEGLTEHTAPIDRPPHHIRIDGGLFTVHYAGRGELLRQWTTAQVVMRDAEIWLPYDESGRELRQSVLHELMHIALYKAGGQYQHPVMADNGDGEPVINPTARMLLNILRDNPELLKWLMKEAK